MALTRIAAPAEAPVSLDEMKAQVRVLEADDDALIQGLLDSAVGYLDGADGILGRCLVTQTWQQEFAAWGIGLRLPFPDVIGITIRYFDADGVLQVLASGEYELVEDDKGARLRWKDSFSAPALAPDMALPIRVEVTAGFGAASDVPEPLKLSIKLLAAHWYENREAVQMAGGMNDVPLAFTALIAPWRRVGL